MKKTELTRLTSSIARLSAQELVTVKSAVLTHEKDLEVEVVKTDLEQSVDNCPHCQSANIAKAGSKGGRKRFKCKDCLKSFNAWTNTPMARLRKIEQHMAYTDCLIDGLSVRKVAKEIGINKNTAFKWRHRFLSNIQQLQPNSLNGLVEADETFFLESFKGSRLGKKAFKKANKRLPKARGTPAQKRGLSREQIPVLVAMDRTRKIVMSVKMTSRKTVDIETAFNDRLNQDAVLLSDGATAYKNIGKKHNIEVRVVLANPKRKKAGLNHINNVNNYDSKLKTWMVRFKGVATKYLHNYIGWHRYLENQKEVLNNKRMLVDAIGMDKT